MRSWALLLCVCASCSTFSSDENAAVGDLRLVPPTAWVRQNVDSHSARWIPDTNPNKEAISVIRTELHGPMRKADPSELGDLLLAAQQTLPKADIHDETQVKTTAGLTAMEVSSDFTPAGMTSTYHRIHAVLMDGDALIHVLYTAKTPDPDLKMFHLVLNSIHRERG